MCENAEQSQSLSSQTGQRNPGTPSCRRKRSAGAAFERFFKLPHQLVADLPATPGGSKSLFASYSVQSGILDHVGSSAVSGDISAAEAAERVSTFLDVGLTAASWCSFSGAIRTLAAAGIQLPLSRKGFDLLLLFAHERGWSAVTLHTHIATVKRTHHNLLAPPPPSEEHWVQQALRGFQVIAASRAPHMPKRKPPRPPGALPRSVSESVLTPRKTQHVGWLPLGSPLGISSCCGAHPFAPCNSQTYLLGPSPSSSGSSRSPGASSTSTAVRPS